MPILFLIKQWFRKKKHRKSHYVFLFPFFVVVTTLLITMFYLSYYQLHLLQNKVDNEITNYEHKRGSSGIGDYDENIYNQIVDDYEGGVDGKGIYDMAIALLNNEYLKDLLTLYTNASSGKYDTLPYHLSKEQYLSIHYNESGTYASMSPIPDGPFPNQGGKIQYKVPLGGLPAEAISWFQYNTAVMNAIGYGTISPTGGGRDVFIFQMNKEVFGGERGKANINGYNAGAGRGSDPYFLPDQCVMTNQQFSELVSGSSVLQGELKSNPNNVAGVMNLTHNRGSAYQAAMGLLYSPNGHRGALSVSTGGDEVMKEALVFGRDIQNAMNKTGYKATSKDLDTAYNRALAVVLLMNEGWYVSSATVEYYSNNPKYFVSAWNAVYPSNTIEGGAQVRSILQKRQGNLTSLIGISTADAEKVYYTKGDYSEIRNLGSAYNSGVIFKVESYTNSAYANTYSNGSAPRQVHAYDVICAGHTLMGVNAERLWEMLLKYAMDESGIDPSDPRLQPDTKFDEQDSFRTEAQLVSKLLSKLGIDSKSVDKNAFELIAMGLRASGGQYSQSKRGQKDSDGTYFRDCSNLVLQAIAWTTYGATQSVNPSGTTATLIGDLSYLKVVPYTKDNWKSQIQSGDILVRRKNGSGHTLIFVGFNNTGSDVELDSSLTRRNQSVTIPPGKIATIEAYSDGYTNGVFSLEPSLSSASRGDFVIKRLAIID